MTRTRTLQNQGRAGGAAGFWPTRGGRGTRTQAPVNPDQENITNWAFIDLGELRGVNSSGEGMSSAGADGTDSGGGDSSTAGSSSGAAVSSVRDEETEALKSLIENQRMQLEKQSDYIVDIRSEQQRFSEQYDCAAGRATYDYTRRKFVRKGADSG